MEVKMVQELIQFSPTYFIMIFNFLVLFLILRKILFKPVSTFMEKRREGIAGAIRDAEQKNLEADALKAEYEKKIDEIKDEAREIIREAKIKAEEQYRSILAEAHEKSALLLKNTEAEIEREKAKALMDLKDQISALAIFAAEKILEKKLNGTEHDEMVGRIIEEVGNAQWQN